VIDLIAAERQRLVPLMEEKHKKVIELIKADHREVFDWVQFNLEQSKRHAMNGFDQLEEAGSVRLPWACAAPPMTASRHL
jgi:hypothetical protein